MKQQILQGALDEVRTAVMNVERSTKKMTSSLTGPQADFEDAKIAHKIARGVLRRTIKEVFVDDKHKIF